jgi:hypothetical protein
MEQLPCEHIVTAANPFKYPKLYDVDYSFDVGHFNTRGASLFTQYLAGELQSCGAIWQQD